MLGSPWGFIVLCSTDRPEVWGALLAALSSSGHGYCSAVVSQSISELGKQGEIPRTLVIDSNHR